VAELGLLQREMRTTIFHHTPACLPRKDIAQESGSGGQTPIGQHTLELSGSRKTS
jgi:hypothetical protein